MSDSALPAHAPVSQSYDYGHDLARLLDPRPLSLEMGVVRLESGVLHVASRTDIFNCTGKMFDRWFHYITTAEHYSWWHPLDHGEFYWVTDPRPHYIGATHIATERLGPNAPFQRVHVHFTDPAELFGDAYQQALDRGDISVVITAQAGFGDEPVMDAQGRPNMARLIHIGRDTPWGMVLRSRFWLGEGIGAPPEVLRAEIPDEVGLGLLHHSNIEFKYLSRVLPSVYAAETKDTTAPW